MLICSVLDQRSESVKWVVKIDCLILVALPCIYTNIMELARGFCKQEDPSGTLQNILQTFLNIPHCSYDIPKASQVVAFEPIPPEKEGQFNLRLNALS